MQDGTAKPISRDHILRRERGQDIFMFPVQLTARKFGTHTLSIHALLKVLIIPILLEGPLSTGRGVVIFSANSAR